MFFAWVIIEFVIVAATIVLIPLERWKDGGGLTYERYITKKLLRRRKKELYIKGYKQMEYEEELNHDLYD